MAGNEGIEKYLPLSESTYYILVSLIEPMHGYAVMQYVEAVSSGAVTLGPGTLYGAFSTLESEKLIVKVSEENRRKSYVITAKGRRVLAEQLRRLELMARTGRMALAKGKASEDDNE